LCRRLERENNSRMFIIFVLIGGGAVKHGGFGTEEMEVEKMGNPPTFGSNWKEAIWGTGTFRRIYVEVRNEFHEI